MASSLVACGGGEPQRVVARIGGTAITKATLDHWLLVSAPTPGGQRRDGVLRFLILAQWLIQEAAMHGLRPSQTAVAAHARELRERLLAPKRTDADLELQARAELAASELRHEVLARTREPSEAAIASYYSHHRRRFWLPERRYFYIDNLHSEAARAHVRAAVEAGRSFSHFALSEMLVRGTAKREGEGRAANERAIFGAKPGVLTAVILEPWGYHSLFEVTRIVRARYVSFHTARAGIVERLAQEAQHNALRHVLAGWSETWRSRTHCQAHYMIDMCAEYRGRINIAPALTLGGAES